MKQDPLYSTRQFQRLLRLTAALIAAALAAGCLSLKPAKNETDYYLLTPEAANAAAVRGRPSRHGCVVRLRPVDLAAYLRTQDIAIRTGSNRIKFLLFQRWAEPLDSGIRRVVAENLRAAPEVRDVLTDEPAPAGQPVYGISIHVLACEGAGTNNTGSAAFVAAWQITQSGPQPAVLDQGVFQADPQSWKVGDYGQLAEQLSRAAGDFSNVLLQALVRHARSKDSH